MDTLEVIQKRASLKTHLSPRDVEPEKIREILRAASLAPSARNSQPWRFVVVSGRKAVETLVTRAFGEMNMLMKDAPVIIVACANPASDATIDGKEYYLFDVALSVQNMLLAATNLGLVTHPMIPRNEAELKANLGIPAEVRMVIATPLAYPAEESYDDAAADRLGQRTRKDLNEMVYHNTWGMPFQS